MATEEKLRLSGDFAANEVEPSLPTVETPPQTSPSTPLHPAVYIIAWVVLSSTVILFNKWLLDKKKFHYPVSLTAWHLIFATIMTQILARTTTLLDGRKTVKMTGRVYLRAIVPIGMLFSCSLIFGNMAYLSLSVAFIQMLKATTPAAVLVAGWIMGVSQPNLGVLFNISFIVLGVIIASFGEITFVKIGFIYQCAGIAFESTRLVLVQKLLNGVEYKMDPLVSLYYYAPVCAIMNTAIALVMEVPYITKNEILVVGLPILFANATVAFLLNVSAVFLIGKTSSLVMALCGILKDILLVVISMLIWNTPVTGMQWLGYMIAVGGLVYYKLGAAQLKLGFDAASREWAGFSNRRPILRVLIVFCGAFVNLSLIVVVLTSMYIPDYKDHLAAGVAKVSGLVDGTV